MILVVCHQTGSDSGCLACKTKTDVCVLLLFIYLFSSFLSIPYAKSEPSGRTVVLSCMTMETRLGGVCCVKSQAVLVTGGR